MVRQIALPQGIGDCSWSYSKLCNIEDDLHIWVPEGYPNRTKPFLDLLPKIAKSSYGRFSFKDLRVYRGIHPYKTWADVLKAYENDEIIYIEPNDHLIAGYPLKDWLPDLPCSYHYQINTTQEHKDAAKQLLLAGEGRYLLGIHTANIAGARAWKAWLPEDWTKFLQYCNKDIEKLTVVFLGGYWDIPTTAEVIGRYGKMNCIDLTGKTDIGTVIEVLKLLNYYIGFSSGLNVMANVVNKPCMALWPDWQDSLKYSWADPEMIENRSYLASVYDEPERIYYRMRSVLPI